MLLLRTSSCTGYQWWIDFGWWTRLIHNWFSDEIRDADSKIFINNSHPRLIQSAINIFTRTRHSPTSVDKTIFKGLWFLLKNALHMLSIFINVNDFYFIDVDNLKDDDHANVDNKNNNNNKS